MCYHEKAHVCRTGGWKKAKQSQEQGGEKSSPKLEGACPLTSRCCPTVRSRGSWFPGRKEGRKAKDKLFTCLIVVSLIVMAQIICMVPVCWVWTKTSAFTCAARLSRVHTHTHALHGYMLWLLSPAPTGEKRKTGGSKMGDCPRNYLAAGGLPWHRVLANLLSGQLVAIVRRLNERRCMP